MSGAARGATFRLRTVVTALGLLLAACSDGATSGTATVAPPEPPLVAAPPDLALECVLPTPEATWEKARAQIGGAAMFLPKTGGGLVAVALHFPLAVSEAIDGRVPAVCAATLAKESNEPRVVIGVHLRWPDRLLDGLTRGAEARFDVRTDAATQIEMLQARDVKDAIGATGVLGNYLLIAARAEDLAALGPYVARTMPVRAKDFPTTGVQLQGVPAQPPIDFVARVPAAALAGPIAAMSTRALAEVKARAAEKVPVPLPFMADAFEALAAAAAVIGDMEGAELRVTFDGRAAHMEATAPLRKGSAGEKSARAVSAGDAAPLLALPKETLAALFVRQQATAAGPGASAAAGASAAGSASGGVGADAGVGADGGAGADAGAGADGGASAQAGALAKALGLDEAKGGKDLVAKLESVTRGFGEARGDWVAAGFAFDGTGPSAFVRAAVKDGGALDGALRDFVALADGASPKDPVRGHKLRVTTGKTVLENIAGDVYRVRLARGGDGAAKGPEPTLSPGDTPAAVDVLFRRSDDVFVAATGYAARDALRALLTAPSGESLQKVPEVATRIEALGSEVSLALFFDPARLTASRAGKPSAASAPVVIGLGRTAGDVVTVFAKLDAPSGALAELSRWVSP